MRVICHQMVWDVGIDFGCLCMACKIFERNLHIFVSSGGSRISETESANPKGGCANLLPPANKVCEGYVFTGVCLSTGGHVWQRGVCVAKGACMVKGACVAKGGVHDEGACMAKGGTCGIRRDM